MKAHLIPGGGQVEDMSDDFFVGWLDAIWSAFGGTDNEDQVAALVPDGVRRALIRRGWARPRSPEDDAGVLRLSITPLGQRVVIRRNSDLGIYRTILDENDIPITSDEWLWRNDQ